MYVHFLTRLPHPSSVVRLWLLGLILLIPFNSLYSAQESKLKDPIAVYLTWQKDPTTTMTIQWITPLSDTIDVVEFRQDSDTSSSKKSADSWKTSLGTHHPLPEGHPFLVHVAEIKNLKPDTVYQFRLAKHEKEYKFRTMPDQLDAPFGFVIGGDTYQNAILRVFSATCRQAAKQSPRFAVIGGDIAYASSSPGKPDDFDRWMEWITTWSKIMITPEGNLIPLLPAIGNHDVKGHYDETPEAAGFYHALFAFPGYPNYNVLDFGNYLSFLLMDSGHTNAVEGKQTEWLEETLKTRQHMTHRFVVYHVPAYPSARNFTNRRSVKVRECWSPLFEKYRVHIAFENHDHTYKRTHPIKNGKADSEGVVYIGDGAWGARPREPRKPENTWYLAKARPTRHFVHIIVQKDQAKIYAVTPNGRVIDSHSLLVQTPLVSSNIE